MAKMVVQKTTMTNKNNRNRKMVKRRVKSNGQAVNLRKAARRRTLTVRSQI